MHNVRRTAREALSDEAVAARRAQEQASLQAYKERERAYLEHVRRTLTQRRNGDGSDDALASTTVLLSLNPEYYSVWNYRREILLRRFAEAGAEGAAVRARLLAEDLVLTQESMRTHPKVYWLWNHRRWCLEMLPPADEAHGGATGKWRKELALVDVMLGMDPRNFMGWNYRRYVVSELASALVGGDAPAFPASLSSNTLGAEAKAAQLALAHEELQYTLRKIESNFSNFSAWHYRSKLLPRVWDAQELDDAARAAAREEGACEAHAEFALLQQAMYTDPSDQSVWLYHSWLVGAAPSRATLEAQIAVIEELAELEPESKCTWATDAGCLESLARYKRQLVALHGAALGAAAAVAREAEAQAHLAALVRIDPLRRARYEELAQRG